jgi:starch-binding outer membrane protein, SusD/RagB family
MKDMKLKKSLTFIVILVASIAINNGCNPDNLNVKPSLATEETYFESEAQFREGVLGVYSKLVFFYNYRGGPGNVLADVRLLADDDITLNDGNAFEIFSTMNADNGHVYDYYRYLYQLVGRANSILDQLDKKGSVYTNTTLRDSNKGELLFLRAYGNFQLYNFYSIAPLVIERLNGSNINPSNSSDTQLIDQAISDLTLGVTLLPPSWDNDNKGRVTNGAGYALLGKCLLFRATIKKSQSDFQAAATAFNKITGYSLVSNYSDNFKSSTENNNESLFEVQLGACAVQCNPWLNTDDISGNGDVSGYWGFFDNHFSFFGSPLYVPTASFKNANNILDPRYVYSVAADGSTIKKYVEGVGGDPNTAAGTAYFNNARIIRLADVKLMNAEALVQSGGSTSDAVQLINDVRKRARESVTPASAFPADLDKTEIDRSKILKWIIEERRIELAFEEGHRWFDLKRWHIGGVLTTVYGKNLTTWDFSSLRTAVFSAKNLDLPIPTSELVLNPNLKQNPAWAN